MAQKPRLSKTPFAFTCSLLVFFLLRFWNFPNFLYFIYDQGRDASRLAEIARGSLALVGPTTGIGGLFLGPFWYYLGLPGFWLANGSPIGIAAWFILLSGLAFPGFWWLSRELFWPEEVHPTDSTYHISKMFAALCLGLFIVLPGSVMSSTTIWNPLIGAPLMVGALYSFWRVRFSTQKDVWIALGFFAVALTLQSEFAYAVFFLPVLLVAIPWMTKRKRVQDFAIAFGAIGITLLPQLVFELRHQFIMTTSVLQSVTNSANTISWHTQLTNRPLQLLGTTVDLFNNPAPNSWLQMGLVGVFLVLGAINIIQTSIRTHQKHISAHKALYLQQLILLFAVVPYPFYLLWRGNGGNFFGYYLTPHFVFLFPLFVIGLKFTVEKLWQSYVGSILAGVIVIAALFPLLIGSVDHWVKAIDLPVNQAGIMAMQEAVNEAYQWRHSEHSATLVITPNIQSTHYDYLFRYYAKQHNVQPPKTVVLPDDTQMILVMEQSGREFANYVLAQRKALTEGTTWHRTQIKFFGMITLEEWQREPTPNRTSDEKLP